MDEYLCEGPQGLYGTGRSGPKENERSIYYKKVQEVFTTSGTILLGASMLMNKEEVEKVLNAELMKIKKEKPSMDNGN